MNKYELAFTFGDRKLGKFYLTRTNVFEFLGSEPLDLPPEVSDHMYVQDVNGVKLYSGIVTHVQFYATGKTLIEVTPLDQVRFYE